jgi:hypothetical protein
MSENNRLYDNPEISEDKNFVSKPDRKRFSFIINIILFLSTFITTTLAGVAWANQNP